MATKPKVRVPAGSSATSDSFQNFAARLGWGMPNQLSASRYTFHYVSRNRIQMEAAYRGSWIVGQAVDTVAEDMTRAGVVITSGQKPEEIETLNAAMERLCIWQALNDTIKWARLYGGAIAVLLIDGQDVKTPLNLETITDRQFKGLLVLDRWLVQPTLAGGDLITKYGPDLGKPQFYDVVADSMALANMRIHHSRCIRLDGIELPYWQRIAENLWGQSVVERLWDRLVAFDSATMGMSQLVYKAHLRTYKIEKLRELIATGGQAYEAVLKQIEMIRLMQSNEGLTLMDSTDEFLPHSYSFSGLSDVILQLGQQLSGALQIPLVRLFGQSPAGLNSTGESDLRMYYDMIAAQQEAKLRRGVGLLLDVLCRSELGAPPPEDFNFGFAPLWQMTDTDKASVGKTNTDAIIGAYDAALISAQTALKELRQQSRATGLFSNISDKEIAEADDKPPEPLETAEETLGDTPGQGDGTDN